MLSYNDLKIGMTFIFEGEPYEVQEYGFLRMQQRKPVAQTKIKNLITGKILERNFHQNEKFEDVEIEKVPINFIYSNRGEFWFNESGDPKKRFALKADVVGTPGQFLKANTQVTAVRWGERIINVEIPIKMDLLVKDAPPSDRGNTAQGGSKQATLETGAVVSVPLFVGTGDVLRVNTQTGEYVERMEKAR